MNEINRAHQTENGGRAARVRAISMATRPTPRELQHGNPVARLRRRKPFRLEFFGSGYRPFRVR